MCLHSINSCLKCFKRSKSILPASWLWVDPGGQCRSSKLLLLLHLRPDVSTTSQSASPQWWSHREPWDSLQHRISDQKMTGMVRYREQKTPGRGFSHFVLATNRNDSPCPSHYGNIHEEIRKDRVEISFTWTTLKHFGTGPILCHSFVLGCRLELLFLTNMWWKSFVLISEHFSHVGHMMVSSCVTAG